MLCVLFNPPSPLVWRASSSLALLLCVLLYILSLHLHYNGPTHSPIVLSSLFFFLLPLSLSLSFFLSLLLSFFLSFDLSPASHVHHFFHARSKVALQLSAHLEVRFYEYPVDMLIPDFIHGAAGLAAFVTVPSLVQHMGIRSTFKVCAVYRKCVCVCVCLCVKKWERVRENDDNNLFPKKKKKKNGNRVCSVCTHSEFFSPYFRAALFNLSFFFFPPPVPLTLITSPVSPLVNSSPRQGNGAEREKLKSTTFIRTNDFNYTRISQANKSMREFYVGCYNDNAKGVQGGIIPFFIFLYIDTMINGYIET